MSAYQVGKLDSASRVATLLQKLQVVEGYSPYYGSPFEQDLHMYAYQYLRQYANHKIYLVYDVTGRYMDSKLVGAFEYRSSAEVCASSYGRPTNIQELDVFY